MRKLIFVNALGKSVAFNDYGLFIATSITGLGDIPVANETQKAPGQDGATWLDAVFDTRMITVEGIINTMGGEDGIYAARTALASVLNPKNGCGTLTYYGGSKVVRMIRKALPYLPSFPQREDNAQGFLVRFEGIDPYWYETSYTKLDLGGWTGGLEFPIAGETETGLEFPVLDGVEAGIEFEVQASNAQIYLHNVGDEETPVEIWMRGAMAQAIVTNETTGECIRVNRVIAANEELYICTEKGNKKVLLTNLDTGEVINAFGYLDRTSAFWQLVPGANLVSYDPAGSGLGTKVTVQFRCRYVGV